MPGGFASAAQPTENVSMGVSEITGFVIVRDVVRNGYPFLEAIFTSLGLCRTIHVLDGESEDESWPSLTALREIVGRDRLVLHQEGWRARGRTHLLAAATNQLREKLSVPPGAWLWNFQANEVVAPATVSDIQQLIQWVRVPPAPLYKTMTYGVLESTRGGAGTRPDRHSGKIDAGRT